MLDVMYDLPSQGIATFTVTLDYAKQKLEKAEYLRYEQV
jgi:hypothetical protein